MHSKTRENQIRKHIDFILLDIIALEVSYALANLIYPVTVLRSYFARQGAVLLISYVLVLFTTNPFGHVMKRTKWTELRKTFDHTIGVLVIDVILVFFLHDTVWLSRLTIGITFATYFVLGYAVRVILKRVIRRILGSSTDKKNALILVCASADAEKTLEHIPTGLYATYRVDGIFLSDFDAKRDEGRKIGEIPVLGDTEEMFTYSTHHWVDEVVIRLDAEEEQLTELENRLLQMGIASHRVVAEIPRGKEYLHVEPLGRYIVATKALRDVSPMQWFLKRAIDIVGGAVGLILTGILFVFIAPQIYRADPGPIFYAANRVGKNGKLFKMYKFRSMVQDADARKAELMEQNTMQGLMFKMDDDPRIIGSEKKDRNGKPKGIGNFIRKTSIDEFPQFLNVLKGDMSLVGTRPPTVDEWQQYAEHHRIRLSMRPGITGMWQVSGRSDITDFEEVVRLDEEYIETWTVGMDIRILLRTVKQVIRHDGAK